MTMDSVLKKLESKIEEFVEAHRAATDRVGELEERVEELEAKLSEQSGFAQKVTSLEDQRDQLAQRLEKVLATIDAALGAPHKATKKGS